MKAIRIGLIAALAFNMSGLPALAQYRDVRPVIDQVNRDYPGLIQTCGGFVDQVANRLNKQDGEVRWGRKARQADGGNPNCDGLTYLVSPADRTCKIIVDIIADSESPTAHPSWQEYPGCNPGNGYWTEPKTADRDGASAPGPAVPPAPPTAPASPQPSTTQVVNLEPLQTHIDLSIAAALKALTEANGQILADEVKWREEQTRRHQELLNAINNPGSFEKVFGNRGVQVIIAGVAAWLTARMTMKPTQTAAVAQ